MSNKDTDRWLPSDPVMRAEILASHHAGLREIEAGDFVEYSDLTASCGPVHGAKAHAVRAIRGRSLLDR